jgi:putative molybdopterin biosynthesis protein
MTSNGPVRPAHVGYADIVEHIRIEILGDRLRPGDRLPTVRAMATSLGVNANTVARAYAELARDGVIETHHGGGTMVSLRLDRDGVAARHAERVNVMLGTAVLSALSMGYAPGEIEAAVASQLARWRESAQQPAVRAGVETLHVVGSRDLVVELLAAKARLAETPIELLLHLTNSADGLAALAAGTADLAGCHIYDPVSRDFNIAAVHRVLPGRRVALIELTRREQGMLISRDRGLTLASLEDLGVGRPRVGTRAPGSGTHAYFDWHLRQARVQPESLQMDLYESHLAVAAAVAGGVVDVGLGIRAAAQAYGLDFVHVGWERYELATMAEQLERPAVSMLLDVIASQPFRSAAASLGGYDPSTSGRVRYVT